MALTDRALRRLSWASIGFFLLSIVANGVVLALYPSSYTDWGSSDPASDALFIATITLFPVVGLLITLRQPRNRIGWLLHATGVVWALTGFADVYEQIGLGISPGSLPGAEAVEVVNSAFWLPPITLMGVYVVLLFPDGHLPSPRWRVVAWAAGIAGTIATLAIILPPGPVTDVAFPLDSNPLGIPGGKDALLVILAVTLPILPLSMLASAAAVIVRFRRATGALRLQLKWLMTAVAFIAVTYATMMALTLLAVARSGDGEADWMLLLQSVSLTSFSLIPISIGIAITRHGLYGIDALISRALLVAALGLFITAVYVGIVVGIGKAIGEREPSVWLSVVATGVVAVAFQPVRERLQRTVNRLVYGARATPYEVLSDFASQMAGRYTSGELLPRLAQTLSECLGGAQVGVWLRTGEQLVLESSHPVQTREAERPVLEAERPVPDADTGADRTEADRTGTDRTVQVLHRGELLGVITVTKPSSEPITPTEDNLLEQVASQTGLVLRNLRLVEDLQSSRERLVTSADKARRRLERDLHDGAQQSLVSIALMLRMAAEQKTADAICSSVDAATEQLQAAIAELRELARGIHPAILTDRGLGPALTSLVDRCPVPVMVENTVRRRLPGPVEGAVYFVAAEALTNIAKYAHATSVTVTLLDLGDAVTLEVADDGIGGADQAGGSGLLGLADRIAVVEGDFAVHSPVGQGTRLECRVPVPMPTASSDLVGVPLRGTP